MNLLNVLFIFLIFKISAKLGIDIPWYLWVLFLIAWFVDFHTHATTANNVVINGQNLHKIGDFIFKALDGKEPEEEEES